MDGLILANKNGIEIRELTFDSYDFEVGEISNFAVRIRRQDYEEIPTGARIYIPGTEFGGLFRELETNTQLDIIAPGGLTWRGMMQAKIIEPPAGYDYATDSGELNAIIKARVEAALPGMFIGSTEDTRVTIPTFQYERYCTLEAGLTKLLASVGYKLSIVYSQVDKAVVVSAVPVIDYSSDVELSSDMQANYTMKMQGDGVNHLICLGKGELKDRTVYHLYVDQDGNIGTTQYYTGVDEVVAIYDSGGSEIDDLIATGTSRLEQLKNQNEFDMTVEPTLDVAVGDIVGGRDYLSGMRMMSPVTGKILRWEDGFRTFDYKLGAGVEAVQINYCYISKQPVDISGALQAYVYLNLTAVNADSYAWQYYNPNTGEWRATTYQGFNTDTLRVRITTTTVNYLFRCNVTGAGGEVITSNEVKVIAT